MNWRRATVGVIVAIPFVVLLAYGLTRDPRQIPSPLPGRGAPDFSLGVFATGQPPAALTVNDTVKLSVHRGSVVVLNFWASWCLACRDEHEVLSKVAERYNDRGVKFYGVLYNDVPANGLRWIEDMGGQSYPSLYDPHTRTAIDYGLYGVPETFFITRDGRVAYKHVGPVTLPLLVQKLDSLLKAPSLN